MAVKKSFLGCFGCGVVGVHQLTWWLWRCPLQCPPGVANTAKEDTVEAPLGHPTQARSKAARGERRSRSKERMTMTQNLRRGGRFFKEGE